MRSPRPTQALLATLVLQASCHKVSYVDHYLAVLHAQEDIAGASVLIELERSVVLNSRETSAESLTGSIRWIRLTLTNRSPGEISVDWSQSAVIDAAGKKHRLSRAKSFPHGPENWLADAVLPDEAVVIPPGAQVVEHVCPSDSVEQRRWYYHAWWGVLLNIETSARCYRCRAWIPTSATAQPQYISLEVSLHTRGEEVTATRRFTLEVQPVEDTRTVSDLRLPTPL